MIITEFLASKFTQIALVAQPRYTEEGTCLRYHIERLNLKTQLQNKIFIQKTYLYEGDNNYRFLWQDIIQVNVFYLHPLKCKEKILIENS